MICFFLYDIYSMDTLKIGDHHAGGIVVAVDDNGHGLVASPHDLSGTDDWDEAMQECADYSEGGFSDWRLPTKEELNVLFLQKEHLNDYVKFSYWSSTEYADHFAWFQDFNTGKEDNDFKDNTCCVRAVREFYS